MSEATPAILQQTNGTAANEAEREADLGFLWDFWYPALRSTEIVGDRLATAMLLEVPLVLGRTSDGKAFAMRDSCPHRGIPLSYGRFDGKTPGVQLSRLAISTRAAGSASKFLR